MAKDVLNDKQTNVIEGIVLGEETITQICERLNIDRSNYYYWKKNNKLFNDTLNDAIERKNKIIKQNTMNNAAKYIRMLEDKAENSTNDNASVKAITKLLEITGIENLEIKDNKGDEDSVARKYIMSLLTKNKTE
ncbi:hypothetical protein NL868_001308 [Shigella flexneri]|nr:hypothetical protein [Shigella flexneri]